MDLQTVKSIAEADAEKRVLVANLKRAIEALAEIAWRNPTEFYGFLGATAAHEAQLHASAIGLLRLLDPTAAASLRMPPFEVIYLQDGSAIPTAIPFDPARPTLIAADAAAAAALEADILAHLESE